jgi:hypothetical protein
MKEKDGWILFQKSRKAVWITVDLALIYVLATLYKTWIDYPYYDIFYWIWAAIVNGVGVYLLYRCYEQLRDSRDYVRLSKTHIAFKDNAWEMIIPYKQIKDLEIIDHLDGNGRYSYKGRIVFNYIGKRVEIPLSEMNLGECDLEIYEAIKKGVEEDDAL